MSLEIFTDGGCRGNGKASNLGANGYVVVKDGIVIHSYVEVNNNTTNNREELKGIMSSIAYVCFNHKDEEVNLYTDSDYCLKCIQGLKTKTPKNTDLLQELKTLVLFPLKIKYTWVKGHSDNKYNEHIDLLLNEAMDKLNLVV